MVVAYSALGTGTETTSNPTTGSITANSGDTVIALLNLGGNGTLSAVYGGSSLYMRRLGKVMFNSSNLTAYAIQNVGSGAATISFSKNGSDWGQVLPISYQGVNYFGIPQTVSGTGTSASHPGVLVPSGGMGVQAFGVAANGPNLSSLSGGTNRVLDNGGFEKGTLSDISANGSFSATLASSAAWGSLYIPLYASLPSSPFLSDVNGLTSSTSGGSSSFNLQTNIGDYVLVDFGQTASGAPNVPTLAGANMTLLQNLAYNTNYRLDRYWLGPLLSGGQKSVALTTTAGQWWTMFGCSVANASGIGTTSTSTGSSSLPSHTATLTTNQLAIQTFAATQLGSTSSGGSIIYDNPAANLIPMYMNASDLSTVFGFTGGSNSNWGSIMTIFDAPLGKSNRFFSMF